MGKQREDTETVLAHSLVGTDRFQREAIARAITAKQAPTPPTVTRWEGSKTTTVVDGME